MSPHKIHFSHLSQAFKEDSRRSTLQSIGEIKRREVELGSRRKLDTLSLHVLNRSFVTLLRTAVQTAIREIHRLLRIGEVPHLLNVVVLARADGLFGLCGSERLDELFIFTSPVPPCVPTSPPHTLFSSLISLMGKATCLLTYLVC